VVAGAAVVVAGLLVVVVGVDLVQETNKPVSNIMLTKIDKTTDAFFIY
jgi:hypothetical protein